MNCYILVPLVMVCVFIGVFQIRKYDGYISTEKIYKDKVWGSRLSLLMNIIPIIPEVVLLLMLPYWFMYFSLRGVRMLTEYVDKEWKEASKEDIRKRHEQ